MSNELLNDCSSINTDTRNQQLLLDIANDNLSDDIALDLIAKDKTTNQMKLFILVQAKRELQRVIKLYNFLTKVEDTYMNKVEEDIDNFSLKQYADIMYTINQSLARADSVIKSVIKDDELSNILIYNDNSINTTNNIIGAKSVQGLESPESRDRVIKAVNNILSKIDSELNKKDDIIIDEDFVDPLEEGMKNNG